jgi:hypothetical protein
MPGLTPNWNWSCTPNGRQLSTQIPLSLPAGRTKS